MATPLSLAACGTLVRYDPQLGRRQQEDRYIYLGPRLVDWLSTVLPGLGSTWKIEESPAEQLDSLLADFCAGAPLLVGHMFKALQPIGRGVWELKTAEVRVFGWFHRTDVFIGSNADLKARIVEHSLYRGYIDEAVRLRDSLDLDPPPFISGDEPRHVVSNWAYP